MTTEHGPDGPLSSEDEQFVTKALRELPAPPVPPALAARLDARLAELQDERASGPSPTLANASAGSSRRWPRLLLAAAAVLAGGYAVGAAVDGSLTGSGSSDSSAEGSAGGTADSSRSTRDTPGHQPQTVTLPSEAATLHPASLGADVRRLLRRAAPPRGFDGVWSPAGIHAPAGCRPPRKGPGSTVWVVRYDGAGAFLLTRPDGPGRVRAELFTCRTGTSGGSGAAPSPVPSSALTVRVSGAP